MASRSKLGKDNKASYKTVLKWEKEFGTKFDSDFHGKDVIGIQKTFQLFLRLYQAWNCIYEKMTQLKFIVCQNPTKLPPTLNEKAKWKHNHI